MGSNDLHIYIHVVPSSAEQSIVAKLDNITAVLEKLGVGGASAEDMKSLIDRAKHSAEGAQQAEKSIEDLGK